MLRWGAHWDDDPYAYETWQKANPTLDLPGGVQSRKLQEYLDRGMSLADFRREHLGLGSGRRDPVVKFADWLACHGDVGEPRGGGWIGIDSTPDSSHSAVVVAWPLRGRRVACALVAAMDGDSELWREARAARRQYRARGIVVDARNPAAHIRQHAKGARIRCEVAHGSAAAAAAAGLAADAQHAQLVIEPSKELDAAARDAIRRPLAEGWAMTRNPRQGKAPISALVALSLAVAQCHAAPGDAPVST